MLTIEIPEVKAQKSAEDEIAKAILAELERDGKYACLIYYYCGIGQGNWSCRASQGHASVEIIRSVAQEFNRRGYIVNYKEHGRGCSSTIVIQK